MRFVSVFVEDEPVVSVDEPVAPVVLDPVDPVEPVEPVEPVDPLLVPEVLEEPVALVLGVDCWLCDDEVSVDVPVVFISVLLRVVASRLQPLSPSARAARAAAVVILRFCRCIMISSRGCFELAPAETNRRRSCLDAGNAVTCPPAAWDSPRFGVRCNLRGAHP